MIDEATVEQFKGTLRGELLQPGDPDYDEARKVYNAMIDKRPRMIARCSDVADVISCVNFARENEMLLAIRGGSHNGAGWAGSGAQELAQLTALFTSALIFASSVAVNSFSAKQVGHMAPPSSRFASSLKPSVAYLELNFFALWKKQTTLPSLA